MFYSRLQHESLVKLAELNAMTSVTDISVMARKLLGMDGLVTAVWYISAVIKT